LKLSLSLLFSKGIGPTALGKASLLRTEIAETATTLDATGAAMSKIALEQLWNCLGAARRYVWKIRIYSKKVFGWESARRSGRTHSTAFVERPRLRSVLGLLIINTASTRGILDLQ